MPCLTPPRGPKRAQTRPRYRHVSGTTCARGAGLEPATTSSKGQPGASTTCRSARRPACSQRSRPASRVWFDQLLRAWLPRRLLGTLAWDLDGYALDVRDAGKACRAASRGVEATGQRERPCRAARTVGIHVLRRLAGPGTVVLDRGHDRVVAFDEVCAELRCRPRSGRPFRRGPPPVRRQWRLHRRLPTSHRRHSRRRRCRPDRRPRARTARRGRGHRRARR